ncbi:hypothetical protein Tco_0619148, partial [Tanacetum coccineum]
TARLEQLVGSGKSVGPAAGLEQSTGPTGLGPSTEDA